MKITIVGHNACGKSTLAKKIATRFDIPFLELDRLWFKHGGNDTTRDQIEARNIVRRNIHNDVVDFINKNNAWVSDGFYSSEQPLISEKADQIVFIDIPLWKRQFHHLRRIWNRSERHPELSIWQELFFTYDMIRRTRERKSVLKEFCEQNKNKLLHFTSHKEVDTYFGSLAK